MAFCPSAATVGSPTVSKTGVQLSPTVLVVGVTFHLQKVQEPFPVSTWNNAVKGGMCGCEGGDFFLPFFW